MPEKGFSPFPYEGAARGSAAVRVAGALALPFRLAPFCVSFRCSSNTQREAKPCPSLIPRQSSEFPDSPSRAKSSSVPMVRVRP